MSAEVSFTKRAAAELSRCFNGITSTGTSRQTVNGQTSAPEHGSGLIDANLTTSTSSSSTSSSSSSTNAGATLTNGAHRQLSSSAGITASTITANFRQWTSSPKRILIPTSPEPEWISGKDMVKPSDIFLANGSTTPNTPRRRPSRPGPPPLAPPKTNRARCMNYLFNLHKPITLEALFASPTFLRRFFRQCTPIDCCTLAQVCKLWKEVLYSEPKYWRSITLFINFNELRETQNKSDDENESIISLPIQHHIVDSMAARRIRSVILYGACDNDLTEIVNQISGNNREALELITIAIHNSTITDKGMECLLSKFVKTLSHFELIGCNEITDSGLWTGLVPNLKILTIRDCINVSDETMANICQLLTSLHTFNLQAYHVTDASMAYFSTSMLREVLRSVSLQHCWEITNQGVVNLSHSLPNLSALSLSGCSKVTDDSIEVVVGQLRTLRTLDLSWCPRISDAALEFIACDLADSLETLVLDRCVHVTDIGLGYIATMSKLATLTVRWCPQVGDFGLQALLSCKSLRSLSIAGCSHVTITGLSFLARMSQLEELELTNCPTASSDLVKYLYNNLSTCSIII